MSLFKSASVVSAFTLLSRITGYAREVLFAIFFGANALTDAFNVAFRMPNLLRRLFAEGAFSQAFVPTLAATRAESGDARTRELLAHGRAAVAPARRTTKPGAADDHATPVAADPDPNAAAAAPARARRPARS